ncbi:MAG: TlpA family protein disulfide reductase [Hymenobacteraceae bacterium]|nr:TlpA family protein disulfide reductase [Hymenobacteraceae bacterium]
MNRRKLFWTSYAVGFAVAGAIALFAISMLHDLVPQKVNWQSLELTDLQGNPVAVEDYQDKVVLVNMWATWCKPCIKEMPALDRLQQLHPDRIAVLAVSDEEVEKLRKFSRRRELSFDILKANTPLANQSVTVFPSTYVLNSSGEVEAIYLGEQAWDSEKMQRKLLRIN